MHPTTICSGARRLQMTTKMGHQYYRGTRTGKMGQITRKGGFSVEWARVRTFVPPAGNCELLPYVSNKVKPLKGAYPKGANGLDGSVYYDLAKS
ncbi:ribosomal protein subunit L27 [Schizosaccharomyces cryophilus OY26]|uniref:Ribosomal protein subunit L27 n=1 Tax=Schizosaccharomyces cryophilus (strain OY26 / ATCC MYA-4695 / CBS 11777 / NBRC 106824 / NRRL Y48691) TaxID=653667 RepID=S9X1D9_SCHCR|nr:ribosomal protein subunit L27 [Schizosaccharomyces cryophilus OY26]EPY50952.1 ribosomal protein subunit L27 [Schizosaccharomyces cryophilus OY26]